MGTNRFKIDVDDMLKLYHSGRSVNNLAHHYGCSRGVICNRLRKAGIKPRNRSEGMFLRMSQTSASERKRLSAAAHDAVRGASHTDEHRIKIAQTIEQNAITYGNASRIENIAREMFIARGFDVTPQRAIDRYNVDLAIDTNRVAVEIFGGHWHTSGGHAKRFRRRFDAIINAGWIPVIIWCSRDYPLEVGAIQYVVTLCEKLSRNEPVGRSEHVIRGDGQPCAIGESKIDYKAIVGGDKCGPLIRGKDGRFTH